MFIIIIIIMRSKDSLGIHLPYTMGASRWRGRGRENTTGKEHKGEGGGQGNTTGRESEEEGQATGKGEHRREET